MIDNQSTHDIKDQTPKKEECLPGFLNAAKSEVLLLQNSEELVE